MSEHNSEINFQNQIFAPPKDGDLLDLMGRAEEIASAAMRASRQTEGWVEEDIEQAIRWATNRWSIRTYNEEDREILKAFSENIKSKELPPRPPVMEVRVIPQYGLGEISFDLLIQWSSPKLTLVPKDQRLIGTPTEDVSNYEWEVSEGEEHVLGLLANTPLTGFLEPDEPLLSKTLRKLTSFRLSLKVIDQLVGFPIPKDIYVLCHRDYAKAVNSALFGAVSFEDNGIDEDPRAVATVLHPEAP